MKKLVLFTTALLLVATAICQTLTVKFTGRDQNGNYHPFSSVYIQNETRGWNQTINYPDTTLILNITQGIADESKDENGLSTVAPNPFSGTATTTLSIAENENVTIEIISVNGRSIVARNFDLPAGSHKIAISLAETQVAFLVASTPTQRWTQKIINRGNGSSNSISVIASSDYIAYAKAVAEGEFQLGDRMSYTGRSASGESQTITQAQTQNEQIELVFTVSGPTVELPTVTTTEVTDITVSTAHSGGNVTSDGNATVTARGVCWSSSPNPTIADHKTTNGSGTGSFTSILTSGLSGNNTYYIRAYATNSAGTAYGNELTFTTPGYLASVTTSNVTNITHNSATCGGTVDDYVLAWPITARGVCWSTSSNPTISDNHTTDGSGNGTFTSSITGLNPNTTYHVRAYATNATGTAYGADKTFTTQVLVVLPTVTTTSASTISYNQIVCGGNVTSDGNGTVTERGVCWSTIPSPTVSGNHISNGTGTGTFNVTISGLNQNTTYYYRAYATNSAGTAYGSEMTVTTTTQGLSGFDENGASNALFSVSATRKVRFSKGNLQCKYTSSTGYYTWRFAENQYDVIGPANSNIASATNTSAGEWFDLFGWGTSGWSGSGANYYYPFAYGSTATDYGPSSGNLTGANSPADWGMYNKISNGGNKSGIWRTMTIDEWEYLLFTRSATRRFAKATVNNEKGLIIFPDDFTMPSGITITGVNTASTEYSTNTFTLSQWNTLLTKGAIFLPAGSGRSGETYVTPASYGYYWSSTRGSASTAQYIVISNTNVRTMTNDRYYGMSVRLVMDEKPFDENGASYATFSVSSTKSVKFSKGNLQYRASTSTWRFAENQCNYIGAGNANASSSYNDWIDLFGWGTSGYNTGSTCYQPWSTSTDYTDYYIGNTTTHNLTGSYANADWGVNNSIVNGGNQAGLWRTLTKDEWDYLLNTRSCTWYRYEWTTIEGVKGIIIYPDGYVQPGTSPTWEEKQKAGCIFLPAAGSRYGTSVLNDGEYCRYWSTTCIYISGVICTEPWYAWSVYSNQVYGTSMDAIEFCRGLSVRLVQDVQ